MLSELFPGEQVLCSSFSGFAAALQGQLKITRIQARLHPDVEAELQSLQVRLQKLREHHPGSAARTCMSCDEQEPPSRGLDS